MTNKLTLREFILITVGSLLYAISTNLFIFPSDVIIGGTSGISVILTYVLDFSPGTIITIINIALILLAFLLLGNGAIEAHGVEIDRIPELAVGVDDVSRQRRWLDLDQLCRVDLLASQVVAIAVVGGHQNISLRSRHR